MWHSCGNHVPLLCARFSLLQESDEGQAQIEWEKQKAREADERRKAAAKAGEGALWVSHWLVRIIAELASCFFRPVLCR